jgi:aquaporin Z
MKRYIAEAIATFFLIFCGTGAMVINTEMSGAISHFGVATAWGLIVMIMIFAYGRISGAHMNPAVTLTLVLLKLHPKKEFLPYLSSQIVGALLASLVLKILFPNNELLGASMPQGSEWQSFVLEFLLTFLLMIVILLTSQGRRVEQYFAPIAIGTTVGLEALFAGPISNASMNPVRSFAPALVSGHLEHLWIYLVATTMGALIAGFYWAWQKEI